MRAWVHACVGTCVYICVFVMTEVFYERNDLVTNKNDDDSDLEQIYLFMVLSLNPFNFLTERTARLRECRKLLKFNEATEKQIDLVMRFSEKCER